MILVRTPFISLNSGAKWTPFWDICNVCQWQDGVLVAYASKEGKGEVVDYPINDILDAIAIASGIR